MIVKGTLIISLVLILSFAVYVNIKNNSYWQSLYKSNVMVDYP